MKKIITIFAVSMFLFLNAHSAQMGSAVYTAITGDIVLLESAIDNPEWAYKSDSVVPDLKGAYELSGLHVTFSNGQVISSNNSTFSGSMSITSELTYQNVTVNGNQAMVASSYSQAANTITFVNVGAPNTEAQYTWDGTYLTTTLSNQMLTEIDTWRRVEDLSSKINTCDNVKSSTYVDGILQVPNVVISDGLGGTISFSVDLELILLSNPLSFELINAERN